MPSDSARADQRTLANGDQVSFDGTYYDFRDADGKAMLKVWVPPNAKPVRGILMSGHGGGAGDSRSFARDANMKALAARFGFGLAGLHRFPGRAVYERGGKVFFDALNAFADLGRHPELAHVPFAIFGSSNGGSTAYGFANYAPDRCICFVSNVATGGNPPVPTDGALRVPGVFVVGRFDPFMREMQGVERVQELLAGARERGARWSMIVEDKGHEDGVAFDVYAELLDQAIALRYPADADPRKGPVKLVDLSEESGWLADVSSGENGLAVVADYRSYAGDRKSAGWLINEDFAFVYRAAATRGSPVGIGIQQVDRVYNPNTAPGTMFSIGGPVVEPGRSLKIVCDVRDVPDWSKIEFFDASRPLGEVAAPNDPVLPITVGKDPVVWCLTAMVTTASGGKHVTPPFYFAVTDPALDLQSDAEKNPPRYADAIGPVGSRTAASVPAGYSPKAGAKPQNVLVAYGLSAEQEKSFGADPRAASAFWSEMGDGHNAIRMEQTTHAREGHRFSHVHTQDARLEARAAHSARGLYLYFLVTDNQFLNYSPDPNDYINTDAIDALIDSKSSAHINDPANAREYVNQDWGLLFSTTQYQVAFGGDAPPPVFKRNRADPWDMHFTFINVDDARTRHGIRIRWVKLDRRHRVQEWFIPWSAIGRPGDLDSEPPVGTRLGFSLGYTDRDRGGEDPGLPKQLRWVDHTTPWAFSAAPSDGSKGWGDIEIGPALGAVK